MHLKHLFFSTTIIFAAASALAQTTEFKNVDGRKGVEEGYNRFMDQTILRTKRDYVDGVMGKSSILDPRSNKRALEISAGIVFKGKQPAEPVTEIILMISPDTQTTAGKLFQNSDRNKTYISPDSEVIAIADGERIALGKVVKTGDLNAFGRYEGSVFGLIPIASYRKMVIAKKLEMAVGGIEIKLLSRNQERLRGLVEELDSRH